MKWKPLALQITQSRRPISVTDEKNVYVPHVVTVKMSKLKIQNYGKNISKLHKRGALPYVKNQYAWFE